MSFSLQRRLQRENKPSVSVDNIKDIIGSQLIVPRRGSELESPASVESLPCDSNVKSALCSLASTKTIMERRPSYSNLAEESSFISRKRAHSLNGSCDSLDQHKSHAASAAFAAARRPRRRPIDPFRELIVLVPGDVDDQIRKMGLTPAEIPEFLLCLEEQIDYDEDGDEDEEIANGHHEERGAAVVVPSIKMEVYTPTVRINQFYEARQKKGCGFNIRSLAPQIGCCHYDEYEADSEDEKFLTNLDRKYEELSRSVKSSKAFLKGEVKGKLSQKHSPINGENSTGGVAAGGGLYLEEESTQGDKKKKKNEEQNSARHHTSDSSLGLLVGSGSGSDDNGSDPMDLQADTIEPSGLEESTLDRSNAGEVESRRSMVFVPESVFQRMFAALERELEVAKGMENLLKETKTLHTKCAHLLEHSKTASELIETFLAEDSDDDNDDDKKKDKTSGSGVEKNLDSIRSLEELILASKREQKLEEEELARPSLISHASSVKVDGKDLKIEGKEGEVKTTLKRGRPLGRVGDKVFPSDSGGAGGGGAGLFGLNNNNRSITGSSGVGSGAGTAAGVVAVAPRRGRPPLSKTRGREKDGAAISTPTLTVNTTNLNATSGTTSLSTSSACADSLPLPLPTICSRLSTPHPETTSTNTFFAPSSSSIIVSPTVHVTSGFNDTMTVERKCVDSDNSNSFNTRDSSNNTQSDDAMSVDNGRIVCTGDDELNSNNSLKVNADDKRCRSYSQNDSNNSISSGNSMEIDCRIKEEVTNGATDYYSTFSTMHNVHSVNNVTFSSGVEGDSSNKSSLLSRNESKDASKSLADAKKDKVNLETDTVYTESQLKSFVSNTRGLFVLRKFYSEIIRKNDDNSGKKEMEESKSDTETDKLLLEVYDFWIKKRSGRFSSLLRCYHNFIMKKWGQQDALPPLPEDVGGGNMLKNGYTELLKLRLALEKARILADRVRRREKLKRDLLKLSGEHLDAYFSFQTRGTNTTSCNSSGNSNDIEVENEDLDEGEIPTNILGKFGTSVLLPFSLEPGNYDVLYEREREKLALNASLALSLKTQEHAEHITERSRERTGSISILTEGRDRTNSITVHARDLTGNGHGATHWSIEDDRLLLLGVAACGVGRWSEIRSEFELSRNSSQMNQRFTRLIRRRIAGRLSEGFEDSRGVMQTESVRERERESGSQGQGHVGDMSGYSNSNRSTSTSSGTGGSGHGNTESNSNSNGHHSRASQNSSNSNSNEMTSSYDDDDDHNETVPEATDLTAIKRVLPQSVRSILDCYEEIAVWESIAVRYLLDTQNHEKRSGRPVLHPLPIPIPVHLLKGKHVLFLHKLIERPSSVQSNKILTAKVIPKSHKKAIPGTTSSSILKFIPLVGVADHNHVNRGGEAEGEGAHGSVKHENNLSNNNSVKGALNSVVVTSSGSTHNTSRSDFSPEKKSKSKNRKRDRNREKEKRREKDKLLRNEADKKERAIKEKETSEGDMDKNPAVTPSSVAGFGITIEKNKKNISGFSTADSSIIHGNHEIMGKRVRSNEVVKKEENIETAVVSNSDVSNSEKSNVKGVSRRTRSNHTESGEKFEMLIIPIVKKVEKVKENGEKRSHKKKKVEPKVAVCTSLLPSALPSSLPSIPPLPCFTSLSYSIQSTIPPSDTIAATADEEKDVIVMMIVDANSTTVTPQEIEVEVEDMKEVEVEIEVARPSWHSQALSFLGIRCEKDKDENALKIAEEKKRLCVSGEIVREKEKSVTAHNDEVFSIVPNINRDGLADGLEYLESDVEKRERERRGEPASEVLMDARIAINDNGDREKKDKKREGRKRARHDVHNGDE
jgi:hypothetical protein